MKEYLYTILIIVGAIVVIGLLAIPVQALGVSYGDAIQLIVSIPMLIATPVAIVIVIKEIIFG